MKNQEQKVYLTIDDLENQYSLKKSFQAKLRMNKKIPYVCPAGSRKCLYKRTDIEEWLETYKVSQVEAGVRTLADLKIYHYPCYT